MAQQRLTHFGSARARGWWPRIREVAGVTRSSTVVTVQVSFLVMRTRQVEEAFAFDGDLRLEGFRLLDS